MAVTAGVAGALDTTGGTLAGGVEVAAGTEPVAVDVLTAGAELLTVVVAARLPFPERVCVDDLGTGGASRLPAEIGSEERPMCWLVSGSPGNAGSSADRRLEHACG